MIFERVTVSTRDSYRQDQEPVSFQWKGKRFEIVRVIDRWYEGRMDATRLPLLYFRVLTIEGGQFILRYHELFRSWGLMIAKEE
jgi:hypothetical protein